MRILFFTLALVAGFVGGWLVAQKGGASGSATDSSDPALHQARGRSAPPDPGTGATAVQRGTVADQLELAFRSGRIGFQEMRALIGALASLSPETVPEFSAFFRDQSMEKEQLLLWRMFFSAWGEFDPDGAIAFIDSRFEENAARKFFYTAVIDTWKNESIEGAFEFAIGQFQPRGTDGAPPESHLAIDYLRSLAGDDPEKALALALKLTDGEFVLDMTARRISELAEQDRNAALEAIETLTGETHLHAAAQYVIDWAKQEPAAAANWISSHFDDRFGLHVLGQVARSFVRADPTAAIEWIRSLPEDQNRTEILAEAVKEWAQTDPGAAVAWLRETGKQPELDSAVIAFSYELAKNSPQEVIEEWVPKISDPQRSNELLSEVSSEWQRANPADFSEWIEQTQALPDEVKQRLLARESPGRAAAAEEEGSPRSRPQEAGIDQGRDR